MSELQTYSQGDAVLSLPYAATQNDQDALSIVASGYFLSFKEAGEQKLEKDSLCDKFSWARKRLVERVR